MEKLSIKDQIDGINELISKDSDNVLFNNIYDTLKALERPNEEAVDFQGWKVNNATLGDIRELVEKTKSLPNDTKVRVFEDDGMGYGANNGLCTDIYLGSDLEENDEIRIWF